MPTSPASARLAERATAAQRRTEHGGRRAIVAQLHWLRRGPRTLELTDRAGTDKPAPGATLERLTLGRRRSNLSEIAEV